MKLVFNRAPKSINKKTLKVAIALFSCKYDFSVSNYTININFTKTPIAPNFPGPFGGFKGLLDKENKEIYIDLRTFIEYKHGNTNNTIHCILHELVHVRDLLNQTLRPSESGNSLYFGKNLYDRCPFSFDIFERIYKLDKKLAQDYNIHALPWEKEAYELPKRFMGKEIYEH